ncbi:MAG: protein kinase domain-containing protein [Phocaeicola sp.]
MKKEEPLIRIIKDKKRFFVKRPQSKFKLIDSYKKAYEKEALLSQSWEHPNLLTCLGMINLESDRVICYKYEAASPLSKTIVEDPDSICYEANHIVNQLLDAVSYIHNKGGVHADIHPENIYITKSDYKVKLINCAQTYLNLTPSFHVLRANYTAPELLTSTTDTAEPNILSDIYSIGKTIEFLYSYSYVTIGVDRVIKKATQTDPSKRYATIEEMRAAFNQTKYLDWGLNALKGIACFGVITLFYFLLANEKPSAEDLHFYEESKIFQKNLEMERNKSVAESTYTSYADMTNITNGDISEISESLKQEEEKRIINENIFKSEFKKAALPIIQRIYTPQLMSGSQQDFKEESLDGFEELDTIQKNLANELGIPLRTANSIASKIISELTEESMSKLTKYKK